MSTLKLKNTTGKTPSPDGSKKATCTRVTATQPTVVTKQFFLNADGSLKRETSAQLTKGLTETIAFDDLTQFKEKLLSLNVSQCLIYGVHDVPKANLLTEAEWLKQGKPQDSRPRTVECMQWPNGPGILMLDYDPPKNGESMSRDDLVESLRSACPGLTDAEMLWWPSASSHIFAGDTELLGLRGQRIYILLADAKDIPRAGNAILDQLWARGVGQYAVSVSGSLLERGLFDGSVWQTNRIDFAAGANCRDGLVQKRGDPVLVPGSTKVVDSKTALPDLSPQQQEKARAAKAAAKASRQPEARATRKAWLTAQVDALKKADPELSDQLAKEAAVKALEAQTLTGNWVLTIVGSQGEEQITVQQVLDNSSAYHHSKCLDPIEPDYDGRRAVGILYVKQGSPYLYSQAHGGTRYRLIRQPVMIELPAGNQRKALDETIEVLAQAPEIFAFGDSILCMGNNGTFFPMVSQNAGYVVAGYVQYYSRRKASGGKRQNALVNPPQNLCNQLVSLGGNGRLKSLKAVITAPTLRPDGTILEKPGYDTSTGFYIVGDDFPAIQEKPTKQQAKAALEQLWRPFKEFPFDGALSRAAHLAAVLTAIIRPALDRAPAFGYDAPIQGSGKTILAKSVAIIGSGTEPTIWPHTGGRDDEEARKRLYSALRAGDRFVIWDNIIGSFDSPALASLLTSDHYKDRILGTSVSLSFPNSSLMMLTGNNLTLAGDLPRRVLISRIDPKSEKPFEREFFIDPVSYCMKNRPQLVAAGLTLLRFYISLGATSPGKGQTGSFEAWDKWVRQTILYVEKELASGEFGDVLEQLVANQQKDPEQEAWSDFLRAWRDNFGGEPIKVAEVMKHYRLHFDSKPQPDALCEAIDSLNTSPGPLTTKKLGKLLQFRVARVVGGLCFEKGPAKDHTCTWRVVSVTQSNGQQTGCEGCEGFDSANSKNEVHINISESLKTNPTNPANPFSANHDEYDGL